MPRAHSPISPHTTRPHCTPTCAQTQYVAWHARAHSRYTHANAPITSSTLYHFHIPRIIQHSKDNTFLQKCRRSVCHGLLPRVAVKRRAYSNEHVIDASPRHSAIQPAQRVVSAQTLSRHAPHTSRSPSASAQALGTVFSAARITSHVPTRKMSSRCVRLCIARTYHIEYSVIVHQLSTHATITVVGRRTRHQARNT